MSQVTITLNGRTYKLACDDGEEQHLLKLAAHLSSHVDELRGSFGRVGDDRLLLMAGLMICDELFELRGRHDKITAELAELQSEQSRQAAESAQAEQTEAELAQTLEAAAERLEALSSKLADVGESAAGSGKD